MNVTCNQPPPTSGGMYAFCDGSTFEIDGTKAIAPVWVFEHEGRLLFMPMGHDTGQPIEGFPWLATDRWSERLQVDAQGVMSAEWEQRLRDCLKSRIEQVVKQRDEAMVALAALVEVAIVLEVQTEFERGDFQTREQLEANDLWSDEIKAARRILAAHVPHVVEGDA